jgi:probable HAF family extracellular repeat protein
LALEPLEDRLCPAYTVIDLGTLGGATSWANAINESGQVVGDSYTAAGDQHGFLWQNGTMTDLGTLGGARSYAGDINDAGQVVGGAQPAGATIHRAYLWQNGAMTDLGTFGGEASGAYAINNNGQIVGNAQDAAGVWHSFVRENGVMYNLDELVPGAASVTFRGSDINDSGQIVGYGYVGNYNRAYLITDDDGIFANGGATLTNLGTLSNGDLNSLPGCVNNSGKVVGYSNAKFGDVHAFLHSGGAMTDLKTLGGPESFATAINDAGQVVGKSLTRRLNYDNDYHAFLWQNGKMTDLNKLRPRGSAGTLDTAQDINNAGQIVGNIRFGDFLAPGWHRHAFLMVPGAPLQADAAGTSASSEALDPNQVQPLLTEALTRWRTAGVDVSALAGIDIRIADLDDTTLGLASGNTIWLNDNAAGWGWFVDPTPWDDSEFTTPGDEGEQNRMDLLTVLTHEIGHLLDYEHENDGVMQETLTAGTRLTPRGESDAAWLLAIDGLFGEAWSKKRK